MEVEVVMRRDNPLLAREEIVLKVKREVTPSRQEARELVVSHTGASPDNVIVKSIRGRSGAREFYIEAYVYKDVEVMKTVEPDYILRRNGVVGDGEAQAEQ